MLFQIALISIDSKDTDWDIINQSLKTHLEKANPNLSVSQMTDYFYDGCLKAVADGAPRKQPPKWFKGIPPDRKILMKKRIKLRKQIEHSRNLRKKHALRENMLNIEREIMRSIDAEKLSVEQKIIRNAKSDTKAFFKFAQSKNQIRSIWRRASFGAVENVYISTTEGSACWF